MHLRDGSKNTFLKSPGGLYSYSDLHTFISFFSSLIKQRQCSYNHPIGILASSSDEYIFIIAACWKLGIPFVCFNPEEKKQTLEEQIETVKPALIFTDDRTVKTKAATFVLINECSVKKWAGSVPHPSRGTSFKDRELSGENIFGYFFTSGTTSKPKIVPLKRRQIITAAKASAKNIKLTPNDLWLLCLPLHHIGGISIILRSLIYKSAVYRMESFGAAVAKLLSNHEKIKVVSLVPTMLNRLLDNPVFQPHQQLKILLGGGPVHTLLLKKAVEKKCNLITSYGMTETCAQIAAGPADYNLKDQVNAGTVFAPNSIEIRDNNEIPVQANKSGTIWLKGPQVFDGYCQTEETDYFDEENWFNTGDYGRLDKKGRLYIETRRTDLIVTGGENVSPVEVEETILGLEGVKEAAVVGLQSEEWGQMVAAAITVEPDKEITVAEIKKQLKEKLAGYKIPKNIVFVSDFPRTASGKIKRGELYKLF